MRTIRCVSVALLLFQIGFSAAADDTPTPSVSRIDYSQPTKYLQLHNSMGNEARIRKVAATLCSDKPEQTLLAINQWIGKNLKYNANAAYSWRDFDAVVDSRCFGGCADYALTFAALARACDIPTVFVKTMDVKWICGYRQFGIENSWSGHVFLEVYVDGRWKLLDPGVPMLYEDYDPAMRILPGFRYAYDKGSDPRALPLSTDWERWKQQTAAHFSTFDLADLLNPAILPAVGLGRAIHAPNDVYVAANSPIWQALTDRFVALGYQVPRSFNTDFDQCLALAKGSRLVISCVGDQIVLPEAKYERYLPLAAEELRKKTAAGEKGVLSRKLKDGTNVVVVYAADDEAMLEIVKTLTLPAEP